MQCKWWHLWDTQMATYMDMCAYGSVKRRDFPVLACFLFWGSTVRTGIVCRVNIGKALRDHLACCQRKKLRIRDTKKPSQDQWTCLFTLCLVFLHSYLLVQLGTSNLSRHLVIYFLCSFLSYLCPPHYTHTFSL